MISWFILVLVMPADATNGGLDAPYEQDFVITAYYSPLPGQCCYVKGGEVADKILNGNGTNGADGTEVYPGMIAAPKSYAFGTRISLPGIGIGTVHDRGGAIVEQGKTHRLDLWAGFGEEGLARALAFGVQRVRGTVYPVGTNQAAENFSFEGIDAPFERLKPFLTVNGLMDVHAKFGEDGYSVQMLQDSLKRLGYLNAVSNGHFGDATKEALGAFVADMKLSEPSDVLTERSAAYLLGALQQQAVDPGIPTITPQSSADDIKIAQRLMRYLGFYHGRTDGVYSNTLFQAILEFQQSKQLVGEKDSPGAGRIGPLTKNKLTFDRKRLSIAQSAERLLLAKKISQTLTKKGLLVSQFLKKGNQGEQVKRLQQLLADGGYFPKEKINGVFGEITAAAVAKYQVDAKLVGSVTDPNAGIVGPFTLRKLRNQEINEHYRLVRGFGLGAL